MIVVGVVVDGFGEFLILRFGLDLVGFGIEVVEVLWSVVKMCRDLVWVEWCGRR